MIKKVKTKDGGEYTIHDSGDFEFVNPIEHYKKGYMNMEVTGMIDLMSYEFRPIEIKQALPLILKKAKKNWDKYYNEIVNTKTPESLIILLKCKSKKDQVNILKGLSLNHLEFIAFIFTAYSAYGYTLSEYKNDIYPTNTVTSQIPEIIEVRKDEVLKVGDTSLSDGELKHIVEFRKAIVAKVLDKGDDWHCFYITYKSLGGKESWKDGQPHYHYISSKFGISREELICKIKSDKYPSTPVHIEFLTDRYRKS